MKVGTRFTLMMLACLGSVGLAYTVVTARATTLLFSQDLKAEARIVQRALNASLTPDVQQGEWDEVHYIMSAIGSEDLTMALLDESAKVRFALPSLRIAIPPHEWISERIKAGGAAEFMRVAAGRTWFCRIEPLGFGGQGYLLVAQDWTALREDRYRRIAASLVTNIAFLLIVAIGIPLLARRYVTQPLAELHRRVMTLGESDAAERFADGDEVRLISEEFKRVAEQLAAARSRLIQESERKLQLERRMLHADKLATIGTLASGFAHEIGTPLGVIRGRAEMLLGSDFEKSKVTQNLEVIIDQIDRITRMVRMLLDLGRRHESIRVVSDVRAIVDGAIQFLETEAVRRGVRVIAELGSEPLMVDCDPDQLRQVFVNLEVNALDAMAEGGGTLRVNSVTDQIHRKVRLSFEDTGPGIPTAMRARIFDPFFTTKGPGEGTGMGLAVSQSIVADHDGELTIDQNSHGACFVVTLPVSGALELAPHL